MSIDNRTPGAYIRRMTRHLNPALDIANRFGGQRPLARWLGHENPTTVSGWCRRGRVPMAQVPLILDAAQRAGVKVELEDFFRGRLKLPRRRA